jgi:hypothetical protein
MAANIAGETAGLAGLIVRVPRTEDEQQPNTERQRKKKY